MKILNSPTVSAFNPVTDRIRIIDVDKKSKSVSLQALLSASKQEFSVNVEQDTPIITVPFLQASQRVIVCIDGVRVQETVFFTRQGQNITFAEAVLAGTWVLVEAFPSFATDAIFETTLTAAQSTLVCSFVLDGSIRVFVGGILFNSSQYSVSQNSITFADALPVGTWIRIEKQ